MSDLKAELVKLSTNIDQLGSETKNIRKLLWGTAMMNHGTLSIPKRIFTDAPDNFMISIDDYNNCIVIKAYKNVDEAFGE